MSELSGGSDTLFMPEYQLIDDSREGYYPGDDTSGGDFHAGGSEGYHPGGAEDGDLYDNGFYLSAGGDDDTKGDKFPPPPEGGSDTLSVAEQAAFAGIVANLGGVASFGGEDETKPKDENWLFASGGNNGNFHMQGDESGNFIGGEGGDK